MTNCACGNFSPSMAINGMVPPSPMDRAGLLKYVRDASLIAVSNQGSNAGAFQPVAGSSNSTVTLALLGGSSVKAFRMATTAISLSRVGGIRMDNRNAV